MVTVSNLVNNNAGNLVPHNARIKSYSTSVAPQAFKGEATQENKNEDHDLKYYHSIKEDEIVKKNTLAKRMGINIEKTLAIPFVHFPRGLAGAPDFTFYEFLQTAKFPFYVGGPVLAALFYAGVKKDNLKAAGAAKKAAKHMALGVGLYYVGAALAKKIINTTTKLSRNVDLNQPYAHAVSTSVNQTGMFKKDVEFHKVTESADFTRWDLLYNKEGRTPAEINKTYADFAPKYGINKDTNDVDSTLKPLIKKTIVMARAWQYALTAFYVTLGIGMANQPAWDKNATGGFKKLVTDGIFGHGPNMKQRLHAAKAAVYDYMLKPFGQSFIEFWKGRNKASSISGKTVILASGIATLTAISLLVKKTSAKHHKIEDFSENQTNNASGVKK